MTEQTKATVTLADMIERGDAWIEVVDGEIVEVDMSAAGLLHNHIVNNTYELLKAHVRDHNLGVVLTDGVTYVLRTDALGVQTTRLPDLSFIRRGRITPTTDISKPFIGAPDLAVEVTSPGQTADGLRQRIRDYLDNGTEQVWVLYVASREVYVYTRAEPSRATIYSEGEVFEAMGLFPGLRIAIARLFDTAELYG